MWRFLHAILGACASDVSSLLALHDPDQVWHGDVGRHKEPAGDHHRVEVSKVRAARASGTIAGRATSSVMTLHERLLDIVAELVEILVSGRDERLR